jgi:hypothetical protein
VSLLDRIGGWRPRRDRDAAPAGMVPADKLAAQARRDALRGPAGAPGGQPQDRELLERREQLTQRFALLQADLGGVFYEMAIRDHVRMDVLTAKAAELQRVDADLAQVERELRGEIGPPSGTCPACGVPHAAEARFCSNCGQPFAIAGAGSEAATAVHEIARTNGSTGATP